MNSILVIVFIILFFFVIKFIYVCHKEYFISGSMIKDNIIDRYPNNIDKYYLLNKKERSCVDINDKNIIRDVSEIIDSDRNNDKDYDIYDRTSVCSSNKYNMGFW
jgi:hypothetical protein